MMFKNPIKNRFKNKHLTATYYLIVPRTPYGMGAMMPSPPKKTKKFLTTVLKRLGGGS